MTRFARILRGQNNIADLGVQRDGFRVNGIAKADHSADEIHEARLETTSEWWVEGIARIGRDGCSDGDNSKVLMGWYEIGSSI